MVNNGTSKVMRKYLENGLKINQKALDILIKCKDFKWEDYEKVNSMYGSGLIPVEKAKQMDLVTLSNTLRDKVINNYIGFALDQWGFETGAFSEKVLKVPQNIPVLLGVRRILKEDIKGDPSLLDSLLKTKNSKERATKFLDAFERLLKAQKFVVNGIIINENGGPIHGNEEKYNPDLYLGRLDSGDSFVLMDEHVYENQFDLDIIKIKVTQAKDPKYNGNICWVGLENTSLLGQFDKESRKIEGK